MIDYAKLMRKRDKAAGPDGKPPSIDLETLRASTRMADNSNRDANNRNGSAVVSNGNQNLSANTPAETKPPPSPPSQKSDSARPSPAVSKGGPPQSPVSPATSNYHSSNPAGPGIPPQPQSSRPTQMMPPSSIPSGASDSTPPTWQSARGYPAEHGSFMRAHAPPSHTRGAPP